MARLEWEHFVLTELLNFHFPSADADALGSPKMRSASASAALRIPRIDRSSVSLYKGLQCEIYSL